MDAVPGILFLTVLASQAACSGLLGRCRRRPGRPRYPRAVTSRPRKRRRLASAVLDAKIDDKATRVAGESSMDVRCAEAADAAQRNPSSSALLRATAHEPCSKGQASPGARSRIRNQVASAISSTAGSASALQFAASHKRSDQKTNGNKCFRLSDASASTSSSSESATRTPGSESSNSSKSMSSSSSHSQGPRTSASRVTTNQSTLTNDSRESVEASTSTSKSALEAVYTSASGARSDRYCDSPPSTSSDGDDPLSAHALHKSVPGPWKDLLLGFVWDFERLSGDMQMSLVARLHQLGAVAAAEALWGQMVATQEKSGMADRIGLDDLLRERAARRTNTSFFGGIGPGTIATAARALTATDSSREGGGGGRSSSADSEDSGGSESSRECTSSSTSASV